MKPMHRWIIFIEQRELRHPTAMLVHPYIGVQHIGLLFCLYNHAQGMVRQVGIPYPIVHVKIAIRFVDAMVVRTIIPIPFTNCNHSLVIAIERGVERPLLSFRAPFYLNLAQCLLPSGSTTVFQSIQIPVGHLRFQVSFRLFRINKRDAIFELHLSVTLREISPQERFWILAIYGKPRWLIKLTIHEHLHSFDLFHSFKGVFRNYFPLPLVHDIKLESFITIGRELENEEPRFSSVNNTDC